jgi:hypothetical protein
MSVSVLGLGATGSQVARQVGVSSGDLSVFDIDASRIVGMVARTPGARAGRPDDGSDVVVLALPGGEHVIPALACLRRGSHVVSISDHPDDVEGLLLLDAEARERGRSVLVGAGFAPGLTCLLARHAGDALDLVEEISIAKAGTGGPTCARQHHRAMKRAGQEWLGGSWRLRRGGSGRELTWFPDPWGASDCYRAWLADPALLHRVYPDAGRITARIAATRRDRLTSRLPMLRPPHEDGVTGAVRVEVRGRRNRGVETLVYGVAGRPSLAAGSVAAEAVRFVLSGASEPGARGLGEIGNPLVFLRALHRSGIRAVTYESSR